MLMNEPITAKIMLLIIITMKSKKIDPRIVIPKLPSSIVGIAGRSDRIIAIRNIIVSVHLNAKSCSAFPMLFLMYARSMTRFVTTDSTSANSMMLEM